MRLAPRHRDVTLDMGGPHAKVSGWIDVSLIDCRGRVVHRHQQHNLVLNKGLDYILANFAADDTTKYVAVGTGTAVPATTDTALVAETARTNATLGLGSDLAVTRLADGQWRISRTRAFDYAQANGNLTEFGGSQSSSSVDGVNTRELFRDGANNPIVVTKTSNERLAITYNIDITLSPTVQAAAANVLLKDSGGATVATLLTKHVFTTPDGSTNNRASGDITLYSQLLYSFGSWGTNAGAYGGVGPRWLSRYTTTMNMTYLGGAHDLGSALNTGGGYGGFLAYTNGNFYRNIEGEQAAEASDQSVYGYGIFTTGYDGNYYYNGTGYKIRFVDAGGADAPYLKNKDYRLKLAAKLSLSR